MSRKLVTGLLFGWLLLALAAPFVSWAQEVRQPDPGGVATGTAADVPAATAGAPTILEVAAQVGKMGYTQNLTDTPSNKDFLAFGGVLQAEVRHDKMVYRLETGFANRWSRSSCRT